MIHFTKHALEKFAILEKYKVYVSKADIIEAVQNPDFIDDSRRPLRIAQRDFDNARVLRVVYKEELGVKVVITFYPGRKNQYEKRK
ncbi:MAG: DUF4258 domain-containing protein [Candidatus Liptonbacteria bacterium]|nr:DUF4258 domain-containing protein [Candidatus Liptonbacteria bacterium]